MQADSMAENLLCNNITDFWKEVRAMKMGKTFLPCTIVCFWS